MRAEEDVWLVRPPLRATVRVFNMSFFRKIITRHDTGLGEAYMDEDYEVTPVVPAPDRLHHAILFECCTLRTAAIKGSWPVYTCMS